MKKISNSLKAEFVTQSNLIEGIKTPYKKVLERVKGVLSGDPFIDNHVDTLEFALDYSKTGVSDWMGLITDLHETLLEGIFEPCGEFRKYGVQVGSYLAPSHTQVEEMMEKLIKKINLVGIDTTPAHLEVAIWAIHHEFESIHPFGDGNGRVGRLILNLLRVKHGLPFMIIQAKRRWEYYSSIETWRLINWSSC